MKTHSLICFIISCCFASISQAGVTTAQLGKLLLEDNYSIVTQDYDNYLTGLTSAQTGTSATSGYHPGIDYRASTGTTVYSPVSGRVLSMSSAYEKDPTTGKASGKTGLIGRVSVLIDGTNDYFIFLHLSSFSISQNTIVKVGDTIGLSGSTGAPAPHLHVEVRTSNPTAAYYFAKSTTTGSNKNPTSAVTLDNKAKMTYVFNMLEKHYPLYFPLTQRLNNTTYFDSTNGYRTYLTSNNYLYLWNGTIWYSISGQWTNSGSSVDTWYKGWGGL